jgi:2-polyprenyl-3-methyl-5-hydroxy-6-metoxy-1,4-benzoquinol methylase
VVLTGPGGLARLTPVGNGRTTVEVESADPDTYVATRSWETAYDAELVERILRVKGVAWLCDELRRDEDPTYTWANLMVPLLAHVPRQQLEGARVLDFGCGSGASTAVIGRELPGATIVGVELLDDFVAIARARVAHHGLANVDVLRSPDATALPANLGRFDLVVLSGVYEHLLPGERATLSAALWATVEPGGHLAVTETPARWWPIDGHTTRLPLVPLLPDRLALAFARRFSSKVASDEAWEVLLRRGIRGGSRRRIAADLARGGDPRPEVLQPLEGDRIDLWYAMGGDAAPARRALRKGLKVLRSVTGAELVPYLALVFRKPT